MSQFRENLRTDGRTDGQALFYRTLPAEARGTKNKQTNHRTRKTNDRFIEKNNGRLVSEKKY